LSTATSVSFEFDAADFPVPPEMDKELSDVYVRPVGIGSGPQSATLARRPHSPEPQTGVRRSLSVGSARSRRAIVTLEEEEGVLDDDDDSVIDAYFYSTNPRRSQHNTPSRQRVSMRHPGAFHLPWTPIPTIPASPLDPPSSAPAVVPPSPQPCHGTFPPVAAGTDALAVKAAYGEVIVAIRVARAASLAEARIRIADKLAEQGRAPHPTFALGYSGPDTSGAPSSRPGTANSAVGGGRTRSGSVSSVGDGSQLRLVASEREWAELISGCGPKLTLRVLDSKN
jgi:hypothetical protein